MQDINRLKWLCRRGTKEMDFLMEEFLSKHYENSQENIKNAFYKLLNYPDAQIMDLVFHGKIDEDEEINQIVEILRK